MIKFPEMKSVQYLENDGFMFQWCCKCKALHIWHFHIVRRETEDKDYIVISGAAYPKLSELRKFYEKEMELRNKKRKVLKSEK